MSIKRSLVLDGEMGELVKASGKVGNDCGISDAKAIAALKSHSESERRRRDRINVHFDILRGLVPSNKKMDKATLLAEVINQVKQLKKTARQASEGLHIPMDSDEIQVEKLENDSDNGPLLLRASLCCDYRPNLLSEVRQAINDLTTGVLKCEISTLKGRVKIVFLIATREDGNSGSPMAQELVSSLRTALNCILDKVSASAEFAEELYFPRKRQRVVSSYVDSPCSSLQEFL